MRLHAVLLCLAALPAPAAESVIFDRFGRIASMVYGGDELAVRTSLNASPRSPGARPSVAQAERTAIQRGEATTWKGSFDAASFEQSASETGGVATVSLKLTAEADLADGAWYWIELPWSEFTGGAVEVDGQRAALPKVKPATRDLAASEAASALVFSDAARNRRLRFAFDRPVPLFVRDRWERNGHFYQAGVRLSAAPLAKGATAALGIKVSLAGTPDGSPARLSLDASRRRYTLDGIGGNYCFQIESPVTAHTLENLQVAWARTEMSLSKWEPENDNDDPAVTNWAYLKSHDTPDSRIRHELELMQRLQAKRIPYVISIWQAPDWLYADPDGGGRWREKRRVPREKWDELAESITSYLVYAKQQYGVEPDLFSFNESNIGINVLLTPEEHRDLIKLLGPRMEKLGLKTRMLLADATGARGTHEFALAAANDPEAMRYVTAVAFHSWGGATPEQYAAWGDLAEWLGLPLLVTELGVDAAAHRGRTYDSFHYGIREVEMYQQLLLHARPRATMHWEFTPDYNLLGADGQPTHRFWFVKQFADLTPRGAEALGTASSHARVLFTAFAKADAYTLHVANLGAAREITIEGIPAAVKMLRAVRTSENERYQALPPLVPQGGALRFPMPARALLTLTTVIE